MLLKVRKFKAFLGPRVWGLFLQAVVIGILWFLVESGFAYVLQGFLSTIGLIPKIQLGTVARYYPSTILGAVSALVFFGFVRSTVIFLRYHYANLTSQSFIRTQRYRVLKYSLENAQVFNTAEAISLFNDRITESGRIIQNFVSIVNLTTSIVLFSLLSLYITPVEFILGMFILAIALSPIRRLNKVVGVASSGIVEESRRTTQSMLVGLRNNFLLRIYGEVKPVVRAGGDSLERYENHFKRYSIVYCLNGSFPHFIGVLAVSIVTFVSLKYLKTPSSSLLAFFYLFFRIAQSASETSALLNEARVYFQSFKTLFDFSVLADKAHQESEQAQSGQPVGRLENLVLENLDFSWKSGVSVFSNLSVTIPKGKLLLIKGESGTGKSTLLSLICGLLTPTNGKVQFNGLDLQEIAMPTLREQIGYVGPESYVIEGSLKENLLFANQHGERVTDEMMVQALRTVYLADEFEKNGVTLETRFNEFTQLSTGQKQRLALARALLRKPHLLILDEATANLDSETEEKILTSLMQIKQNLITVVVSHRNSFDTVADSKLVLRN